MKIGAFVLGIIGGLFALSESLVLYGFVIIPFPKTQPETAQLAHVSVTSLLISVLALAGAGMVMSKPKMGAYLMASAALIMLMKWGLNALTLVPIVLLGVSAFLGFLEVYEAYKQTLPVSPLRKSSVRRTPTSLKPVKSDSPLGDEFFKE
ncbi:MAG: hypothetical protein PHP00_07140 [Thiotrichaceae bacterium]|nr:hypothetical protein [Thiotrichaceae bacterium]